MHKLKYVHTENKLSVSSRGTFACWRDGVARHEQHIANRWRRTRTPIVPGAPAHRPPRYAYISLYDTRYFHIINHQYDVNTR